MNFKDSYTLEQRTTESKKIMNKHPFMFPVILSVSNDSLFRSIDLPNPDKFKYLVPNISMSQFIFVVRRKLRLKEHVAIYFMIKNVVPLGSELISTIYEKYKDEDGFLYITVTPESFFG